MESDSESLEEDEEEFLVYVEFEGFISSDNNINSKQLQLDMIGIDTDHPIMQINGKFYEGTYEDTVGTYMFFNKDDNPVIHDPIFDQVPNLKYFTKTRKLLKMKRVFIKQRTEVLGDSEHSESIPNLNTIMHAGVAPKYQQEALSFWKEIRDNRIDALSAYLEKQRIRDEKRSQGITPDSESDEDNPFAIYKHKEEFKNVKQSDNLSTRIKQNIQSRNETIIPDNTSNKQIIDNSMKNCSLLNKSNDFLQTDCRPSTSKSSKSWTTPSDSKEKQKTNVKTVRKKKGVTIKNASTRTKKYQTDTMKESSYNVCDIDANKTSLDVIENKSDKDKSNDVQNTSNEADKTIISYNVQSDSIPTSQEDSLSSLDRNLINTVDKQSTKLSKRELKIKEITERLRIIAEDHLKKDEQ